MEQIKKIIKNIFKQIGIEVEDIKISKDYTSKHQETLKGKVKINSQQAEYFFKNQGEGLNALQHLLRILVSKKNPDSGIFVLDINNYKKQREEKISELALQTAKKVRKTKRPVSLNPMPPFERRLIHLKLAEQPDIVTESTGEEPERKVIIRPYP